MSLCCGEARPLLTVTDNSTQTNVLLQLEKEVLPIEHMKKEQYPITLFF